MAAKSKPNQTIATPEVKLQDYIGIVFRQRWLILGTLTVVFAACVLYTQLAERLYQATAGVRIDTKQMRSTVLGGERESYGPNVTVIQNELEVLKSNAVAEVTARRLLDQKYVDNKKQILLQIIRGSDDAKDQTTLASVEAVTTRVKTSVEFDPVRDSDVIKITASSKSPQEAAIVANAYTQAYAERNVYTSRSKTRSFREFLESQVRDKEKALKKSEEEVRNYMEQKGVVSLDEESKRVIEQLSQLEAQRDAVEISIQSLEKTIASYREQVSQQEVNVAKVIGEANDGYIRLLQDQLAQLEVQRDITVAQNPAFVGKEVYNTKLNEIEGQIQALRAKLKKRTDDFLANLLPGSESYSGSGDQASYLKQVKQKVLQAQIELQAQQARKQALIQAIQGYNRQFEHLPRKTMEYARLQREKMSTEKLYVLIDEKYNEANITEQAQMGYIDIFDPAVEPMIPYSPKVAQVLLLGLLGGLGLGLMLALVKERLQERVRTPDDVKKRGYTLLSTVPDMEQDMRVIGNGGKILVDSKLIDAHLIMVSNPMSPVAETYRQLRTSLFHLGGGSPPKVVLVTSPDPGAGKTTTVSNLAIAFAQSGRKVLLIEADLRRPTIRLAFNLPGEPGLSEVLAKTSSYDRAIQHTLVSNLHILTSGSIPERPSEQLESESMKKLIEDMRLRYDVVLLDSPPILAATDASVLTMYTDCLLLVISSGVTTKDAVTHAVEGLESVGAKIAGIVLNNFNLTKAYGLPYTRSAYGYYGYSRPRSKSDRSKEKVQAKQPAA